MKGVSKSKTAVLIRQEFHGAVTEIGANKVMCPKSEAERAWNESADMAIKFIRRYINGEGLFQL